MKQWVFQKQNKNYNLKEGINIYNKTLIAPYMSVYISLKTENTEGMKGNIN